MPGIKVFLSYSHADEGHLDELVKHLDLLRRQGLIEPWYDRRIEAGANVHAEIEDKLNSADVILLLVSPDFVFSDYCYDKEMKTAMERHREGSATVIPAILRPCDWHSAPFGELLAVPKDGQAVTEHTNRDRAYLEIAQAIRKAAERARTPSERTTNSTDGSARGGRATRPTRSAERSDQGSSQAGFSTVDGYGGALSIRREFTDWQKDEFGREAFENIARHFEHSLNQLQEKHAGTVKCTLRRIDAASFEATAYVDGRERSRCGVWVGGGGAFSRNSELGYSSRGVGNKSSYNEVLHIEDDGYRLYVRPVMGLAWLRGREAKHDLTPEEAAEHLWRMFMQPMQ